ncbi:hypothetical protein HanHA300_Chr14g0506981 [Helianthus annuus]|nr:hypothetical protein HanHA300_Chr14g0506981 [Helianthus annuus]KAJ0484026.1 hypothetical protein HanHA89_Chr14g0539531 [Helianthus annuus]
MFNSAIWETCIYKDRTRTKILVSLDDAFLNAIHKYIEGLAYETKRCYNIYNILKISSGSSMCVNPADGYILFSV